MQVNVPPLSYTILLLQQDPLSLTNVTEDKGFSLSVEGVRSDGDSSKIKARVVPATLIEAFYIQNQSSDCNSSYSINNTNISATILACKGGKLTLNLTSGTSQRLVELEFRGYGIHTSANSSDPNSV